MGFTLWFLFEPDFLVYLLFIIILIFTSIVLDIEHDASQNWGAELHLIFIKYDCLYINKSLVKISVCMLSFVVFMEDPAFDKRSAIPESSIQGSATAKGIFRFSTILWSAVLDRDQHVVLVPH